MREKGIENGKFEYCLKRRLLHIINKRYRIHKGATNGTQDEEKENKITRHDVLDTTMHKQIQIT